jgi:aminoglycoside N3'-acetyltransferase
LVDQWLDEEKGQRRGRIGHGEARLVGSRTLVATARARLAANQTVFLHETGVDVECDEARASLRVR